jgi:hypothetical protein
MRRILLAGLIVSFIANLVCAQKRTTIFSDAWTGVVVATSDATHEITLRHPDKSKAETFVGILEDGYKVKMKDGSLRELKVSEITLGTRLRVLYKTKQLDVSGKKVKVHSIHRVDFLGIDEYTKLREALKQEPSIPVILAESTKLPTTHPLKVYLAIEQPYVKDNLITWMNRWNKEQAAKYGSIELAPDPAQADIALVVYWGKDETVDLPPAMIYDERRGETRDFFPATAHLVTKEDEGLKVLWQKFLLLSNEKSEGSAWQIEKEIEKRMKARLKK